ncbi:MAG: VanZ family protein [Bacteroidales bacterium]
MKENDKANRLTNVLFVIYLLVLVWVLILKLDVHFSYMDKRMINLIPFAESTDQNGKPNSMEMVLNALIFIPLGVYAGILFKKWTIWKKIPLFFLTSLSIEIIQFILSVGAADITDIINNTAGGLIGLLVYMGIEKAFRNGYRAQKFLNFLALAGTVFIVLFLFLLKIKALWIIGIHFRYQ